MQTARILVHTRVELFKVKKCLKGMFLLFRKACLLYKTSKIVSSRFIFRIYDMGIQGVTRGYKGLQGVTTVYEG